MTITLECPPPPGLLELRFPLRPVSLQAKKEAKAELQKRVRGLLSNAKYFLSGEVEVSIEWLLHPKIRYEGVHSPDIDNILKPLLDALSGPSGVLVNDCQVQSVRCSWIDWMKQDHELHLEKNQRGQARIKCPARQLSGTAQKRTAL